MRSPALCMPRTGGVSCKCLPFSRMCLRGQDDPAHARLEKDEGKQDKDNRRDHGDGMHHPCCRSCGMFFRIGDVVIVKNGSCVITGRSFLASPIWRCMTLADRL